MIVFYTKKDIRLTYGLHNVKPIGFLGALFIILGMYPLNILVSYILFSLFPQSVENVTDAFSAIMNGNVVSVFFVLAAAPAVCEEMLFRDRMSFSDALLLGCTGLVLLGIGSIILIRASSVKSKKK